ncbi:MAG: DUF1223 domain-containing protein [Acidobacteriota bacterium]
MSVESATLAPEKLITFQPILWGGLLAGILDITAACINSGLRSGRSPQWVLQSVASGLLGVDAYKGGWTTALLGLFLHFLIAFVAATIYYFASRKLSFLVSSPILSGFSYGIAVYLFMYFVVLRLAFSNMTYTMVGVATGMLIHMFCVGLPIALAVRRFAAMPLMMLLLATLLWNAPDASAVIRRQKPTAQPAVLVELFTSEGCSTCPSADILLTEFEQTQPVGGAQILILSEHVDYWNRLGWKDRFSAAGFTERQLDYARVLKLKDIYTPQLVIDGRVEVIGNRRETALEEIARASRLPKAAIGLEVMDAAAKSLRLRVQVDEVPLIASGDSAEVILAISESDLQSNVSRGENAGRELRHSAVARRLKKIGDIEDGKFNGETKVDLNKDWNLQNLKALVFVQERKSRHVLGAATIKLSGAM